MNINYSKLSSFIESVLDAIVSIEVRDNTLLATLERLRTTSDAETIHKALPLISRISKIEDTSQRCKAYCLAYSILQHDEAGRYVSLSAQLSEQLKSSWEEIDVGWVKVDVGFQIAQSLASISKEMALGFLGENEQCRAEIVLDADNTADAYIACVRLAIRAYAGLLTRHLAAQQDHEMLERLIDLVPSRGERAGLWADIALCHHVHSDAESCKRIVNEHVKPLLENVSDSDRDYKSGLIADIAPAIYCANPTTAPDIIDQLPAQARDRAYMEICNFILTSTLPFDPHETTDHEYELSYDSILELLKILERIEPDFYIYSLVETIVASMTSRRNRLLFTQQKKLEIARHLETLVDAKLPNRPRFIKHDGYKIAALAQVAKLRQAKPEEWTDLIDRAGQIDNLADRALVLGIVAEAMPSKQEDRRKTVVEKVREVIKQIPSALDQATRYVDLGNMLVEIDKNLARECIQLEDSISQ